MAHQVIHIDLSTATKDFRDLHAALTDLGFHAIKQASNGHIHFWHASSGAKFVDHNPKKAIQVQEALASARRELRRWVSACLKLLTDVI